MNAAANGTTSLSLGAAFTIIVNAWLHRFGYAPLSVEESEAYTVIVGSLVSYYLHLRTQNASLSVFLRAPKAPAPPAPAAP